MIGRTTDFQEQAADLQTESVYGFRLCDVESCRRQSARSGTDGTHLKDLLPALENQ